VNGHGHDQNRVIDNRIQEPTGKMVFPQELQKYFEGVMPVNTKENYFLDLGMFLVFLAWTIRACMPKYWETPIAWHWSRDVLSKETISSE
jgi:hypothetical protein